MKKFSDLLNKVLESQSETKEPEIPTPGFRHINDENSYCIVIPPEAMNPEAGATALLCATVVDKVTGEARLAPFINIPVMVRTITEVNTLTGKGEQRREWDYVLDVN